MVWLWIGMLLAMLGAGAALLYAGMVARDVDQDRDTRTRQLAAWDQRVTHDVAALRVLLNMTDATLMQFRGAQFNELDRQVKGLHRSVVYLYDRLDVAGNDPATKIAHQLAREAGVQPALPTGPAKPPTFTLADDGEVQPLTDPRD